MSYWVSLHEPDPGEEDGRGGVVAVAHHEGEGGAYRVGGSNEADLSVTYNYCRLFDFAALDGRTGADTLPILRDAIGRLGTDTDGTYWAPTEGNAGHAASILCRWAEWRPDGIWRVS